MKTNTPLRLLALVATAAALTTAVLAAPKTGDTVYSKYQRTEIYAEAKKSDSVVATAGFGEALKIASVNASGCWFNVSVGGRNGWVFFGMVSDKKPEAEKTASLGSVDASSTNTAAAVRPISDEAKGYAERHNLVEAGQDVDWVEAEAHKVTAPIVNAYMKENKKGEFQE